MNAQESQESIVESADLLSGGELPSLTRPEPNGIDGFLRTFSLCIMVLGPLAWIIILSQLQQHAFRGLPPFPLVLAGITGILGFVAGYTIYSGSFHGQSVACFFLLGLMISGELVQVLFRNLPREPFTPSSSGPGGTVFLNLMAVGCFFYLVRSPRSRNNYNKKYRALPIREPLSRLAKGVCLSWGLVSTILIVVLMAYCLSSPNPLLAFGFSPIPEEKPAYSTKMGYRTITVPPPKECSFVNEKSRLEGGLCSVITFAAPAKNQQKFFFAGYVIGTELGIYSNDAFAEFKKELKSDQVQTVEENDNLLINRTEISTVVENRLITIVVLEAVILLDSHLLYCVVRSVDGNKNPSPENLLYELRSWVDAIIAANTAS